MARWRLWRSWKQWVAENVFLDVPLIKKNRELTTSRGEDNCLCDGKISVNKNPTKCHKCVLCGLHHVVRRRAKKSSVQVGSDSLWNSLPHSGTYIHTYIRTYNTWLYFISNLQSSSKATEYLRENKRKIHLSNCWLYVDSLSIKTSRTALLFNDSSFSLFLELKKCHTTEQ